MITLTGKSVFGGVAIGKIAFYKRNEITIKRIHVDDTEGEVKRFETAKEKAVAQLQELYDKAMEDVGESNAMIFEIHQMMLEDLDYVESIVNIITTQEVNAEYAIGTTADNLQPCSRLWMMHICKDGSRCKGCIRTASSGAVR